jgi:DNA-binding NarL/FixJ family response regulator
MSAGIRRMLEHDETLEVVGDYTSVNAALGSCGQSDVIVLDPDSEEISLHSVSVLAQACESRILVFTSKADAAVHTRAIELGAAGVVTKDETATTVARAIHKVHAGELWLDRARTAAVLARMMRRGKDPETVKIESLTKREREVVGLVGEGMRNSAIAGRLFISEATVRNHLTSILGKLELADRFDLAVYAFRHELVPSPDGLPRSGVPPYVPPARPPQESVRTARVAV